MKYKITFKTGSQSGAGTDADVTIKVYGSKLVTNEITLTSQLKNFEKGTTDSFYFESANLGEIEKIKVGHNNKLFGADWLLDEINVENNAQNKFWHFPIYKWITSESKLTVNSVKTVTYDFEFTTGILPGSGTKDNVQICLVGSKSYTKFIGLNQFVNEKEFKTGHTESFSAILEDVGEIKEIKIKLMDELFHSNWFLSKVNIKRGSESKFTSFPFHCWVKPGKVSSSNKELVEYTVKFYTGDVAGGGTDANVFMIIYGTRGETNPIPLNKVIARNAFEAGNVDYIKIAYKKLGSIKRVKIWHDEKWLGDGWFLNKISIKNENSGVEALFPYYSWLDKSADPKSTNVEINRMPVQPRPFYAIAHMVNTPAYVEEALDLGSNAVEFDIMPKLEKDGNFSFDVFHGFRPDFDPDKINLMERSIARTGLSFFLKSLKQFEEKYKQFSLVIYDCKLEDVAKNKLELCGQQLAKEILINFYGSDDINRIYSIISVGKKRSAPFLQGFMNTIPKDFKMFIGFDLSMEKFQTTEKVFENIKSENFWWGSGIASTVPKPLKHFIPQFLIAAKKRTKRGLIKKIYYWTLDDPDSMARMLVTKLDGIIVNDPLKLLRVLEKEEFKHSYKLATRNDDPFAKI